MLLLAGALTGCNQDNEPYTPTGAGLTWDEDYTGPVNQPAGEESEQSLKLTYYPDRSMNPYTCTDFTNRALFSLLYQSLFAVDRNYDIQPQLCKSYRVSEDMKSYTFYLDNATFTDGVALTAMDVLVSLQTARDSAYYGGRFTHISDIELSGDGGVTVKTFYRDEEGDCWLLPHNEKYAPIQLTSDIPWRIVGKVIAVRTDNPHTSTAGMLKIMKRAKKKKEEVVPPSERAVRKAICRVADSVTYGRLWFAVYRALVDQGALMANDYNGFVALLRDTVPDHEHLPVASELKRMSVQSFNKPLPLWQNYDAPVQGARFDEYYRIALEVTRYFKD
jgi:hypothetical protein